MEAGQTAEMLQKDRMLTDSPADDQIGPEWEMGAGPSLAGVTLVQDVPPAQVTVNREETGPKSQTDHKKLAHFRESPERPTPEEKPISTKADGVEREPILLLSPISEMAQRIGGVTLKRQATDPASPTQPKKRRLFEEGSSDLNQMTPSKSTSTKKSVRKTKRDIRGQMGPRREVVCTSPDQVEIDFPSEWLTPSEQNRHSSGHATENGGFGGCPPTATNDQ